LEIQGKLIASNSIKFWPLKQNSKQYEDFITFRNCNDIEISGGGKIDGRGYKWWMVAWLNDKKLLPPGSSRPHLIFIEYVTNLKIHDLILKNSPSFHIKIDQALNG
jgi:hypothetical protein